MTGLSHFIIKSLTATLNLSSHNEHFYSEKEVSAGIFLYAKNVYLGTNGERNSSKTSS